MPPNTSMVEVMAQINNPSCSNPECPNSEKNTSVISITNVSSSAVSKAGKKCSPKIGHNALSSSTASAVNSGGYKAPINVWMAELRVRYVPKNLKELFEQDRTTCNYYFDQVKQDYIQTNQPAIDQDIAVQLCCLGIRHYYKDTNQTSDKKHHIDYIEKEIGFSNFIPKSVIESIKQKNLKKLIQAGYKKVYTFTDVEYMLRFFDLLRSQYIFDQEQFIVTLGSGWNIPVDLIIGPHQGISYLPHPQAQPTRVTDFQNIECITTTVLSSTANLIGGTENGNGSLKSAMGPTSQLALIASSNNSTASSPLSQKKSDKGKSPSAIQSSSAALAAAAEAAATSKPQCSCHDIKTQLRIKVNGNEDELAITCNGAKTAENIADLVDGYCRIVNNSDVSLWDRTSCE